MPEIIFLFAYSLLGMLAGVLAGLLGVGGGLLIVPVLIGLFSAQGFAYSLLVHAAIGSSLATIIATAVSSTWAHHRHAAVSWIIVRQLAPGLFVGAFIGAWLADLMDTKMLQTVFGVFAIVVSFQLFFRAKTMSEKNLPGKLGMKLTGTLIGTVSGIVGIGGGSMTVPFLTWHNQSIRKAVATSSACGLPIAIAGFVGFVIAGWSAENMPVYSSGYIYWPAVIAVSAFSVLFAPLGAHFAHRLPVAQLKQIFAVVLFLVGLKLTGLFDWII